MKWQYSSNELKGENHLLHHKLLYVTDIVACLYLESGEYVGFVMYFVIDRTTLPFQES